MKSAAWKISDFGNSFYEFAKDIKLSHSIFALPFAASIFFLVDLPVPSLEQAVLLLLAMIGARSFAMGFNRYADRILDFGNPRTRQRAIPAGRLAPHWSLFWTLTAAAVLIGSAFGLNPVAGLCSFPLLVVLAFYSYWKRFSWACHWYLGACLGLAPLAVCVALTGQISGIAVLLGLSVALWTAGFDILYSLQDHTFDSEVGLNSIPSRFGVRTSLIISRLSFTGMILGLAVVGVLSSANLIYYCGMGLIAGFLVYEHLLIRGIERDGSQAKLNQAFFNQNAYVSVFYLAVVVLAKALS